MTAILDAIDDTLTAYAAHLGSPWPGRIPSADELLEALLGPEDSTPVASATVMALREVQWVRKMVLLRADCRRSGRYCADDPHEPCIHPEWPLGDRGPWIQAGHFSTNSRASSPAWLVEEDAWLADRATREAATR